MEQFFDTSVNIETNQKQIKERMETLYHKTSIRVKKQKLRVSKKVLYSYLLVKGLTIFTEEEFDAFLLEHQ